MKSKLFKKVDSVIRGSAAEEAGIEVGDKLILVNGNPVRDIFDYKYLINEENVVLQIEKASGEIWDIEIEKDIYEDLGLIFDAPLMDSPKFCQNSCIFCFMDQLAPGMRKTLHFKDDDYRLSFLEGNYVTLTNVSDDELKRIIYYRLSPINVSVHTTNPELRVKMLNNPDAGRILKQIKMLSEAGITINCQIVLCKDVNDGEELNRTIEDLTAFFPNLKSISVVPVGLTKFREKCFKINGYEKESSLKVIKQVQNYQRTFNKKFGSRIVFLADEFYLGAGLKVPSYKHYEDFPQIENGVGMIASFKHEFNNRLKRLKYELPQKRRVSIVTGTAAEETLKSLAAKLTDKYKNLEINIYGIKNGFFGSKITVAGLITGNDIIKQVKGKSLGSEVLIPEVMLKHDEDIFLDDVSLKRVGEELNVKVTKVRNDGKDFVNAVLGMNNPLH